MSNILNDENIICIILSGGISSRMKTHKALLRFSESENFLQHIISVYQSAGIKKIIVVKNADIAFKQNDITNSSIAIVENNFPEKGRLYSIQLGLSVAPDSQYCYIQNIDNPFISGELVRDLYNARKYADYIAPEYKDRGGHPILISSEIINKITGLTSYSNTLRELLEIFSRHRLYTEDEKCLLNINLPADYEKHILRSHKTQSVS